MPRAADARTADARGAEPELWAVAGCLFEVAFPAGGWRWDGAEPASGVTLVGERTDGASRQHVRFRAEAAGVGAPGSATAATAGTAGVALHFSRPASGEERGGDRRSIRVRVAPEHPPS